LFVGEVIWARLWHIDFIHKHVYSTLAGGAFDLSTIILQMKSHTVVSVGLPEDKLTTSCRR